jgi:hypothetical protein
MYITLLYEDNYAIQFLDPSSQPTDGCGVSRGTLPYILWSNIYLDYNKFKPPS